MSMLFLNRACAAWSIRPVPRACTRLTVLLFAAAFGARPARALDTPLTTTFIYQGELVENGTLANGLYDFRLTPFDELVGGNQVAQPEVYSNIPVTNGRFQIPLDFGSFPFGGSRRWLAIEVRAAGGPILDLLAPRQEITATPYAIHALNASISLDDAYEQGQSIDADLGPVTIRGDLSLGEAATSDGRLDIFSSSAPNATARILNTSNGAELLLRDSGGSTTVRLEPDPSGSGGFLQVNRDGSNAAFRVDGNSGGTGDPRVSILGSARGMTFDTTLPGNAAVQLPTSAIDAVEILDEPGLATVANSSSVTPLTVDPIQQPPGFWVGAATSTIVTPAPGKILAIGTASVTITLSGDVAAYAWLHLTTDPGIIFIPPAVETVRSGPEILAPAGGGATSALASGKWRDALTVHKVFDAPVAGPYTIRLVGAATGYNSTVQLDNSNLTLLYVPSDYSLTPPTSEVTALQREQDALRARLEQQQALIEQLLNEHAD